MEFTFDIATILDALWQAALLAWSFVVMVFWRGGWIVVMLLVARKVILRLWDLYLDEIRGNYIGGIDRMTLAIRVPKLTEQTPKAVENIFAHLAGLQAGKGNLIDQYVKGKVQETIACELVSINGSIQFFINTPVKFRDVIEAAIFAQYPDVDIDEVPDYVDAVPKQYPNDTHDLWGTELTFVKPHAYPIKTYQAFEHVLPGSFKDPLASLLEFLGALRPGEQVWIQIALKPTDDSWQKESENLVKKMIGVKTSTPKPKGVIKFLLWLVSIVEGLVAEIWPGFAVAPAAAKKDEPPSMMQHLSPGERAVVEQVQMKASKLGFLTKIRVVYVAPKEVFNKGKIISGVLGAFKQYGSSYLNSFKPEPNSKVGADYFRVAQRVAKKQNTLIRKYKGRGTGYDELEIIGSPTVFGGKPYIMNIEELATIWHFPMIETKAPLVRKSEFKRAEPPSELPMREERPTAYKKPSAPVEEAPEEIPGNLPFA